MEKTENKEVRINEQPEWVQTIIKLLKERVEGGKYAKTAV